jgi:sugar phosphate isomerase/epimerase
MSPSRFSVISDEVSQDPADVLRFIRDFGLSGFELRSMFGRAFRDLTAGDVAAIRRLAKAEGLRVHGCATPVFKCELDDLASVREHIDVFRRSLEVAGELDCGLLRVFTFLRPAEALDKDALDRIVAQLTLLADLAARSGARIGIENESSCRIGSGSEMVELAGAFRHPAAGWIWDPCNVLYVPGASARPTAGFSKLVAGLIHIHVKDAVRTPGAQAPATPALIGAGEVGWGRHLAEIRASGYPGLLSLETHWRRAELDRTLLHLPAGHAFSAGGDEASRLCMQRLVDLWAAAGRDP